MSRPKTRYIPALDGIRAFAVLSVIAYHMEFTWASGGLLGVTIFFVLSGYLITGLLIAEWDHSKTIRLKDFWLRRVKRLLPAIVFLLLCVTVLTAIFNQDLLTKMRPDVLPSLFFYSNWWYILRDLSYFEALGAPSPLSHFWSLAIEEQFYIIWPLFILIMLKIGVKKPTLRNIALGLAAVSALAMAILFDPLTDPSRVYYGTDTRVFSLLIGAVFAFIWPMQKLNDKSGANLSSRERWIFDGVGIAAFIALIVMVGFTDGYMPFMYRGGMVLVSVLTAIVIAVVIHPMSNFAKVLSLPPLRWIGERSYGMYLWHLPIILLMTPRNFTGDTSVVSQILQLVIIFAVSGFSFRFIENPIRKGAIGRFIEEFRTGAIDLADYVRQRAIPVGLSALLVLGATGCFILVPPTSAVGNADGLDAPADADPGQAVHIPTETDAAEPAFTYDVLMIGDSVSVRAIPYFQEAFPNGAIDSAVSRQLYTGSQVYSQYRDFGSVGDIVVFSLGTNGVATDDQLDELIGNVGSDKHIFLINTRCPESWEGATNAALASAAQRYDNVDLIDWYSASAYHDDYFDGDGTHLTELGAQVYVDLIKQAVSPYLPADTETAADQGAPDEGQAATE